MRRGICGAGSWIITPEAASADRADAWLPEWLEASYLVKSLRWRFMARERAGRERSFAVASPAVR